MKKILFLSFVLFSLVSNNVKSQDLIYTEIDSELTEDQRSSLTKADDLIKRAEKSEKNAQEIEAKFQKFDGKKKFEKKTWEAKQERISAEKNYEKAYNAVFEVYSDFISKASFYVKKDGDNANTLNAEADSKFQEAKTILSKYKGYDKSALKKLKSKQISSDLGKSHNLKLEGIENQIKALKLYTKQSEKKKADQEDDLAWQDAKDVNTIASFNEYLNKFSSGKYIAQANKRIKELEELAIKVDNTKSKFVNTLGYVFKVQVAASPTQLSKSTVDLKSGKKKTEFSKSKGFYKYRTGEFNNYKDAAKLRDEIMAYTPGAFVVVFLKNKEVEVTEEMKQ